MTQGPNQATIDSTFFQNLVDSVRRCVQGQQPQNNDALEAFVAKIEALTHLRRDQLAQAALLLFSTYFVLSSLDGVLHTAFGLYYPLYQTVKALSSQPAEEDFEVTNVASNNIRHWLAYWATYAAISPFDTIGTTLLGPFFLFVKTAFLVYLYLPQTSGALTVFDSVIKPTTLSIGQTIVSTVSSYRSTPE